MRQFPIALLVVSITNSLLLESAAAPTVSNSAAGPSRLSAQPNTSPEPPPVQLPRWRTPGPEPNPAGSRDHQATANKAGGQIMNDRPLSPSSVDFPDFDPNEYTPASSYASLPLAETNAGPDRADPLLRFTWTRTPTEFERYREKIMRVWPFSKIPRTPDPYRHHTAAQKQFLQDFRDESSRNRKYRNHISMYVRDAQYLADRSTQAAERARGGAPRSDSGSIGG